MILDDIAQKKSVRLKQSKAQLPLAELRRRAETEERKPLPFAASLRREDVSIIAEVKKASPSKGVIRPDFCPTDIAADYLRADVQAMSVLTEEDFFQGSPGYLSDIRAMADIPLLRKDFILDVYQLYEAYLLGADAVLLIAALLTDSQLAEFGALAASLGMECLAEVHNEAELERVLRLDFPLIGINNRNLYTFEETLSTTGRLMRDMPAGKTMVGESGIRSAADLAYVRQCGVHAVLIGEAFMRETDIPAAVERLRGR